VVGRAFELASGERIPIACGRNSCPVCRRRNVFITAAMLGLDAAVKSPVLAVTTTTERWLAEWELREATAQFVRAIRREISPGFEYAWQREWTTGLAETSGGRRRTHYHWLTKGVERDDAEAIQQVARRIWGRLAGAHVHHVQSVWDAAGFGRYIAGLVGHHLKQAQAPPPGWRGRRMGASRGYYSIPALELRGRAEALVREERLIVRLERFLADEFAGPDYLDGPWLDLWEQALEDDYVRAIGQPAPRVVGVAWDFWLREEVAA